MSIIKSHNITLYGGNDEYKIILRPLSDNYLPLLYKWNSDPEVLYWSEGMTLTRIRLRWYIKFMAEFRKITYALLLK